MLVRTGGNSNPVFSIRFPELVKGMSKLSMKNGRRPAEADLLAPESRHDGVEVVKRAAREDPPGLEYHRHP
jgi:hypothetical protein